MASLLQLDLVTVTALAAVVIIIEEVRRKSSDVTD